MSLDDERERMVKEQIENREVRDPRVLDVMRRIRRHLFVPEPLQEHAYEDRPQPIGCKQTISQPLMVGLMTELLGLTGSERVLEIGTGSGYQSAILAELAGEVYTIERHTSLAERAKYLLEYLGYTNVYVFQGDGTIGYLPAAPYDRILVTAGSPRLPEPLMEQLAPRGIMVLPVGDSSVQTLTRVSKDEHGALHTDYFGSCFFVPLVGEYGWSS